MNMKFIRTWAMLALTLVIGLSVTGGTIAWFSDSVSSTNNIIQSGNLDIELEYKLPGDEEWKAVEANTPFFNSTLWEPGHTEAVALRVKNAGTLALKYEMEVKVIEERESTNVYGDTFKLSDHLKVLRSDVQADGVVGDIFMDLNLSSRDNVLGNGSTAAPYTNDFGTKLDLSTTEAQLQPGEARVFSLAVTMPTTVDNVANHKTGVAAPRINFGIELRAAQLQYEEDSFGSDYDANATYPDGPVPGDLPQASITTLNPGDENYPDTINYQYSPSKDDDGSGPQNVIATYKFTAPQTQAEAANSKYADWHADFVVYADKDIPANGLALIGQYGTWGWLGFMSPDSIAAGKEIRLLKDVGQVITRQNLTTSYEEICGITDFFCGLATDNLGALAGTKLTVELRLYEATGASTDTETGTHYLVSRTTYDF